MPEANRSRKDEFGRMCPPRSSCCRAAVVHYSPLSGRFIQWWDYPGDEIPEDLHCERCNANLLVREKARKTVGDA